MSRHPISGWRNYTFSEIAKKEKFAIVDGPFGTQLHSDEYTENGVPVVRIENLSFSGRFKPDNLVFISEKKAEQLKRSRVVPGDLIIAKTGATIGKSGMFPDAFNSGIIASSCMKISCDTNFVDPKLILYMIVWEEGQKKILEGAGGSTRTSINIGPFSNIQLYLPESKSEQRKIAEILTAVDDAIEQTEALIHKYQRIKQGLMQDLLTRGVDEKGCLRPPPELAPHLYIQTPQGWLPKGWEIKAVDDLSVYVGSGITPRGGSEVYGSEGVMFIRSQNVTFEGLLLNDVAYIDDKIHQSMCRSEIFPYDVLINITGASIGRCCVFPDGLGRANVNQHVCAIRFASPNYYDAYYLSYVLSSWVGQSQIDKLNAGGNRQGLNYQQLRSFQILWPERSERKIIVDILKRNDELITIEKNNHLKLLSLKQGLMQDLLTGKVRVNALLEQ